MSDRDLEKVSQLLKTEDNENPEIGQNNDQNANIYNEQNEELQNTEDKDDVLSKVSRQSK